LVNESLFLGSLLVKDSGMNEDATDDDNRVDSRSNVLVQSRKFVIVEVFFGYRYSRWRRQEVSKRAYCGDRFNLQLQRDADKRQTFWHHCQSVVTRQTYNLLQTIGGQEIKKVGDNVWPVIVKAQDHHKIPGSKPPAEPMRSIADGMLSSITATFLLLGNSLPLIKSVTYISQL
jgi:hypothetical protein